MKAADCQCFNQHLIKYEKTIKKRKEIYICNDLLYSQLFWLLSGECVIINDFN